MECIKNTMALQLSNIFECRTWDEWTVRINMFNGYYVRKAFYPHKMDVLESMMKKLEFYQRESVKATIEQRENLPEYWTHLTQKERDLWNEQTAVLKSKTALLRENFEYTLNEILILERNRLYSLVSSTGPRIRSADEEEAAEGLLLLSKIAHQEARRKHEQSKRQEMSEPVVARRSCRLQEK